MKRLAFLLISVAVIVAFLVLSENRPAKPILSRPNSREIPAPAPIENRQSKIESPAADHSPIADHLNAPDGTIRRDLEILNEVFAAWQTNFPREGNPVGENVEITAALAGDNPLHFAFISRSHPAINARGELCDRWGTPFFFHAMSGTQMIVRSAGPDKKLWTSDDVSSRESAAP